jgi:glycosyltransferase involved in cell wall biosynthesis
VICLVLNDILTGCGEKVINCGEARGRRFREVKRMTAENLSSKRLRVAVIASGDPTDIRLWSGVPTHILQAFEPHFDFVHVEKRPFAPWFSLVQKLVFRSTFRRIDLMWSSRTTSLATIAARRRLNRAHPDVVIVISSSPICRLVSRDHKTVTIADATGKAILDYYPAYGRLSAICRRNIIRFSGEAITQSILCLYPSDWARSSAIDFYGVEADRAVQIAWGPSFDKKPGQAARVLQAPVRLLFVGVDWLRKGGPHVLQAAALLADEGIDFRLDIVGHSVPKNRDSLANVTFHGKLDRRLPDQAALLDRLYAGAHLFVLPTRSECFGMVFAEAASYALPSISVATGGVTSSVLDGKTGLLVSPDGGAEAIAAAIASLVADPERYARMSQAALTDSIERLDWSVWAARAALLIEQYAGATEELKPDKHYQVNREALFIRASGSANIPQPVPAPIGGGLVG